MVVTSAAGMVWATVKTLRADSPLTTQLSRSPIGIANGSCGGIRAPSESAFLLDGPSSRTPFDRALISDGDQRGYRTPA
jgi:hypothetical protein